MPSINNRAIHCSWYNGSSVGTSIHSLHKINLVGGTGTDRQVMW
jgi:uncharacterized protein YodC (DUF2158 family)